MTMTINEAIDFLEGRGFLVKGYGFPESDTGGARNMAESYRVIQGDFDTGMIEPQKLIDVARHIKQLH